MFHMSISCGKSGHIQKACRSKSGNLTDQRFGDSDSTSVSLCLHSEGYQCVHHTIEFDDDVSHTFIVDTERTESTILLQVQERLFLRFE